MPGRKVIDYTSALIEFEGGARGTFTVTQAAAGGENDIRLRVYGEKGMLEWWHREPGYLKLALQGEPVRTIGRGDPFLPPEIIALGRTPRGHPEGLCEAFANIYAEVAQERMARALGEAVPELPYPRIEEGAHTMAFIEACVASQPRGAGSRSGRRRRPDPLRRERASISRRNLTASFASVDGDVVPAHRSVRGDATHELDAVREAERQAAERERVRGGQELAVHRVAAFAVERLAGGEIALRGRDDVAVPGDRARRSARRAGRPTRR